MEKFKVEDSIAYQLNSANRSVKNYLIEKFKEYDLDISIEQWILLSILWNKDGRNQTELTVILDKDKTTLVRLINSLETKNLVTRIKSEKDTRIKLIYLTPYGKKIKNNILNSIKSVNNYLESLIDKKDLDITRKVLKQIVNLKNQEQLF